MTNQADAFSIVGSLTALNGLENYNSSMLFGEPTKRARLGEHPDLNSQPQAHTDISASIYWDTEELEHGEFDTVKAYASYMHNQKKE